MNRCCHCKLKKALMGQNQCCHIFLDGLDQILPDIVFVGPICTTNPVFVALAIGQNAIIKQTLDAHCTCICLGNRLSSWLVAIGGLSKNIPSRCIPNNVGPPSYVRWFINPMNTIVFLRIINHRKIGVMFINLAISWPRGPHDWQQSFNFSTTSRWRQRLHPWIPTMMFWNVLDSL